MEDDPQRGAFPRPQARHAVALLHAVGSAGSLPRAVRHREGDRVALGQGHDLGAGLHAWTLLGQDKYLWYPNTRLFTSPGMGNWQIAISKLAKALADRAAERKAA